MTDHYLLMTARRIPGRPYPLCLFLELLDKDVNTVTSESRIGDGGTRKAPFDLRRVTRGSVSFRTRKPAEVKTLFTSPNVTKQSSTSPWITGLLRTSLTRFSKTLPSRPLSGSPVAVDEHCSLARWPCWSSPLREFVEPYMVVSSQPRNSCATSASAFSNTFR